MNISNIHFAQACVSLVFFGCSQGVETNVTQLDPDIAIAPNTVEFGGVVVLYDDEKTLQVINAGRATLVISDMTVEDDDEQVYTVTPVEATLEPDDSMGVGIRFEPTTYLPYNRDLIITSNDPESPQLRVPIRGEGVDGPIPDIVVTPPSIDFGSVAPNTTVSTYFTIQNVGDGDLIIEDTTQTGGGAFEIQMDPEGFTLSEDETTVVPMAYTPETEKGDSGGLTIVTNDPDEPSVDVVFLGNGGGEFEYPVALIDCPKEAPPPTTVSISGSDSYDPNGNEPLVYEWSIEEHPQGSSSTILDPALTTTSLFVDMAGTWRISLTVTNSIGISSAPAECEFEAIPEDMLYVELSWDSAESDVDLHLLQEGYSLFQFNGDCCWCNPNPSWGESGTTDDPDLSLDNTFGFGPESTTLPYPYDGDYYVKAHYFSDNGGGYTVVTVRVHINGVLEHEDSELLGHNDVWDVGYVRWPEGFFVAEDNSLYAAEERSCWQ